MSIADDVGSPSFSRSKGRAQEGHSQRVRLDDLRRCPQCGGAGLHPQKMHLSFDAHRFNQEWSGFCSLCGSSCSVKSNPWYGGSVVFYDGELARLHEENKRLKEQLAAVRKALG